MLMKGFMVKAGLEKADFLKFLILSDRAEDRLHPL
jgi:hypothetical protein